MEDRQEWTDYQVRRERSAERAAGYVMIGWLLFAVAFAVWLVG